MRDTNDYRYERKFVLPQADYNHFMLMLKKSAYGFRQAYPERFINSIYFDDFDLTRCYENIDGVADRTKIRVRWYGECNGVAPAPKLELKIKKGLAGTKEVYPLTDFDTKGNLTHLPRTAASHDLPADVKMMVRRVAPVIMTRYRRKYLISRNGRFRLTFDDKIRYFNAGHGFIRGQGVADADCIVEIKYSSEEDHDVDRISSLFPMRMNKNSKYVKALSSFYRLRW